METTSSDPIMEVEGSSQISGIDDCFKTDPPEENKENLEGPKEDIVTYDIGDDSSDMKQIISIEVIEPIASEPERKPTQASQEAKAEKMSTDDPNITLKETSNFNQNVQNSSKRDNVKESTPERTKRVLLSRTSPRNTRGTVAKLAKIERDDKTTISLQTIPEEKRKADKVAVEAVEIKTEVSRLNMP